MASAIEKLFLDIKLVDGVSGPAKNITGQISTMNSGFKSAFKDIAIGTVGFVGTAMAMYGLVQPAREMNKALGEVASLGAMSKELKLLQSEAMNLANKFGLSSTEIVRSAYNIQDAISTLGEGDLAKFTANSALLAKATKSNADATTKYIGKMAGIFSKEMAEMGNVKWVDDLTEKTAKATRMFNSDTDRMAVGFAKLGVAASSVGVGLAEQVAILGTLGSIMGEAEAGAAYKAILKTAVDVEKTQKNLNMSFVDSQGKILPLVNILEKIREKTGDVIGAAESDVFIKTFGQKGAAAIMGMLTRVDDLKKSTDELNKVTGLITVTAMAEKMIDPFAALGSSLSNLRVVFGQAIIPLILPVINFMSRAFGWLMRLIDKVPFLGTVLASVTVGVVGLIIAFSALKIVFGVIAMVKVVAVGLGILKVALIAAKIGVWGFSAALWANPITWIVAGVFLLIGVLVLLAVKFKAIIGWFDNLPGWAKFIVILIAPILLVGRAIKFLIDNFSLFKAVFFAVFTALKNWFIKIFNWFDNLPGLVQAIMMFINPIFAVIKAVMLLSENLEFCKGFFVSLAESFWAFLKEAGSALYDFFVAPFVGMFNWIDETFSKTVNSILGFLRKIPGVSKFLPEMENSAELAMNVLPEMENTSVQKNIAVTDRLKNNKQEKQLDVVSNREATTVRNGTINNNSSKVTNYGGVNINVSGTMSAEQLEEQMLLYA